MFAISHGDDLDHVNEMDTKPNLQGGEISRVN
jgi:hypothetical protein